MKHRGRSLSILTMFMMCSLLSKGQYAWQELGSGAAALNPNAWFLSTTTDPAGNVYAAGMFTDANGYRYVAKWDGTTWTELGTGINALKANNVILSIIADATGNIYAAGYFTNVQGNYYVAKWNGAVWSELGASTNAFNSSQSISCLAVDATGNIYAAGESVFKWDGVNWIQLGLGANALQIRAWPVSALTTDAAGNVYAAGQYTYSTAVAAVAKWNGITWIELGAGSTALNANNQIYRLVIDAAGNLYAAGAFSHMPNGMGYVARWDGLTWSEVGTGANTLNLGGQNGGSINALAIDDSGNIYAGGAFENAIGYRYVAKWDGSAWSELGTGCYRLNANLDIFSISISAGNDIYAAGIFRNTIGNPYVAQYVKTNTLNPIPAFTQVAPVCSGGALNPLPLTSLDGFTGTWSPAPDNTKTTTYTFTPGADQCASTATMTIVVTPGITPTFNPLKALCSGTNINPLPAASIENIAGSWSPAFNNSATTTYTFTPTANATCTAPATITVVVNALPTIAFISPDISIAPGSSIVLNPVTTVDINSFVWSPATDLSSAIIQSPTATPMDNITYTLKVTDVNGCVANANYSIGINRKLFMPSAFTPNLDGKNELFRIAPVYHSLKVYYFSIFNRYGSKIFTTQNPAIGWDGNINGRLQDPGVYVWCIKYQDPLTNKIILQQGTVMLIK